MSKEINIMPIGDRVVVRREVAEKATPGGILLPDQAIPSPRKGTVLAIGPGMLRTFPVKQPYECVDDDKQDRFPMQCKVGDKVILPHICECLKLDPADDSSEICIVQECQLLAILQ